MAKPPTPDPLDRVDWPVVLAFLERVVARLTAKAQQTTPERKAAA